MYTSFFGLREKPFALSPDPRFLFLSAAHREALAHLLYGIEQGEGFIAVTGEVGTGKTTLCRTLLRRLGPEVEVAFLFNPKLSARELIEAILVELGLEKRGESVRELIASLNQFLLERRQQGRRVLLIIDEAQGLAPDTLEQIRLLSNLETETEKLIQILLLGQPELDAMLESEDLRQLRQRIAVRWRLAPLSRGETADYVRHRLRVSAQAARDHVFPDATLREVFRHSRGVPRVVNLLCDRALLAAYADGSVAVAPAHVVRAVRETGATRVSAARARSGRRQLAFAAVAAAALGVAAAGIWQLGRHPFATAPALESGPGEAGAGAGTKARPVSAAQPADAAPRAPARATPAVSEPPEAAVPAAAALAVSAAGGPPPAAPPAADPVATAPAPAPGAPVEGPPAPAPADVSAPPPASEPSAALLAPGVPALADASPATPGAPARVDDLAHALALRSPGTVAADALASMFEAWSVRDAGPMPSVIAFPDVMAELQAHGLAVVAIPGADVERLRAIGHPALLVVSAEDRVPRLVALRRLVGDEVELRGVVADAPALVSAAELERRWSGEAYVVWREFEPLPAYLRMGDAGAGVSWLQRALAELGFSSKPPSGVFDGATEDAVRAFQADHRLEPDGTVGPLTKMSIYQALGRYGVPAVAGGGAG